MKEILDSYKDGNITLEEALKQLGKAGISDLGFARLDLTRQQRSGFPEVIYGGGKTVDQVVKIAGKLSEKGMPFLITRATGEMFSEVSKTVGDTEYNEIARTITKGSVTADEQKGYIALVAAGTSDMPVAEEAFVTASYLGHKVEKVYDVGVAGIHRLFDRLELIRNASVVIVVAGMEGALTSVVTGLVNTPVIGVPTSVGYGSSFNGLSALLAMLNSCAPGVSVVNIDNGFGAACQAALINRK